MDPITFAQLNAAYHKGVYGQEEVLDIQEWVEALIDEGYDLDEYSDDELYEAYFDEVTGGGKIRSRKGLSGRPPKKSWNGGDTAEKSCPQARKNGRRSNN